MDVDNQSNGDSNEVDENGKNDSNKTTAPLPIAAPTYTKLDRLSMRIKWSIARAILAEEDSHAVLLGGGSSEKSQQSLLSSFVNYMNHHYGVRGIMNRFGKGFDQPTSAFGGNKIKDEDEEASKSYFDIEFVGENAAIQQCKQKIRDVANQIKEKELSQFEQEKKRLLAKQSGIFTYDWRFVPSLPPASSTSSASNARALLAWQRDQLRQRLPDTTKALTNIAEDKYLPQLIYGSQPTSLTSSADKDGGKIYCELSKSLEQTFLRNMKIIMEEKLHYSLEITFHAMILLSRYLIYLSDTSVKENVTIISAIISLTLKTHHIPMKTTLLRKICLFTYQQIFYLNNTSTTASIETNSSTIQLLLPKIIEKEYEIYLKIFVNDCYSFIYPCSLLKQYYYKSEKNIIMIERLNLYHQYNNDVFHLLHYLIIYYNHLLLPFTNELWMTGIMILVSIHYQITQSNDNKTTNTNFPSSSSSSVLIDEVISTSVWLEYFQTLGLSSAVLDIICKYWIQFLETLKSQQSMNFLNGGGSTSNNSNSPLPEFLEYYIKTNQNALTVNSIDRKSKTLISQGQATKKSLFDLTEGVTDFIYMIRQKQGLEWTNAFSVAPKQGKNVKKNISIVPSYRLNLNY